MKKEILYRVFRIFLIICFVTFLSILRNNVSASYQSASKITNQMSSIIVTPVSNNIDKSSGLTEEHIVDIKNVSNKNKDVSFVLSDTNDSFPYEYMNYSILKNNIVVKQGVIKENNILYTETIDSHKENTYKIVLNISQEDIITLGGVSISAKISFI